MTHNDKIVEAVARAIYDEIEGPVANQDFGRQVRQWELAQKLARAAITAYQAEAWQPIETAPQETWCLVFTAEGEEISRLRKGRWQVANSYGVYCDPTHWQPLPNPPASS